MKDERKNTATGAYEWLETVCCCLAAILFVFLFCIKTYTVSGNSMVPTLRAGDDLLVLSALYTPKAGDIVVLEETEELNEALIKRVVALEGETVDIDASGQLTVDGTPFGDSHTELNLKGDISFPLIVPEGCIFVLGDNRGSSLDSRYAIVGCPRTESVIGKAVFRYSPADSFGGIE